MPTTVKTKKTTSRKKKKKVVKNETNLEYYKLVESANEPVYATEGSACFDLFSCFNDEFVNLINAFNEQRRREVAEFNDTRAIHLNPGDRVMVPTGLVLNIPEGYFVRLFARSGLALSAGLVLSNSVGVIDSDYKNEVFVLLTNNSQTVATIEDNTRICQGLLEKTERFPLVETSQVAQSKTRSGGFGSTGVGELEPAIVGPEGEGEVNES
jgi:dUTP pyrophosphatase